VIAKKWMSLGLLAACAHPGARDVRNIASEDLGSLSRSSNAETCNGQYPFSAESLLAERVGFGSRAIGGDPSKIYRVTTLASDGPGSLRNALVSDEPYWIVFDVEGTIKLPDGPKIKSNRTVDGRGRNITIDGGLRLPKSTRNVILSDIKITFPSRYRVKETNADLISVYGLGSDNPEEYTSRDLWFHHLELTQGNDGAIDLRGASGVTISWCRVHHHEKGFLMNVDADHRPTTGMQVTMHHNYFEWISRRGPKMGFGELDFFNNYTKNFVEYGVVSHDGARLLSENNIFEARPGSRCLGPCHDPNTPDGYSTWTVRKGAIQLRENQGTEADGFVKSRGDVLLNDATIAENKPERVFERADYYPATLDAPDANLRARLVAETGPRTGHCRNR